MEHIPSHLFDLVEHTPFHELDETQKAEVLTYFTEAEYTALYQAAQQAYHFHREMILNLTVAHAMRC